MFVGGARNDCKGTFIFIFFFLLVISSANGKR